MEKREATGVPLVSWYYILPLKERRQTLRNKHAEYTLLIIQSAQHYNVRKYFKTRQRRSVPERLPDCTVYESDKAYLFHL